MDDTYLLRSLKRVYDECERAISNDDPRANTSIADKFNEVLQDFKQEFPDEERIQEIEEIQGVGIGASPDRLDTAKATIQEIKFQTLKIADLLDLDTDDFGELSERDEFTVINIHQEQTQEQAQTQVQRVTVEQIINDVEGMMIGPENQEELKELVQEYEDELESEDPDASRLREIAGRVGDYSDDAMRKLIMLATERGFNILAGLI